MASINFVEVRFDVRDEHTTHCYVRIEPHSGDVPHMVLGWHHKAFPASMTTLDIHRQMAEGDNPMMWERLSPPETLASEAGALARAILTWDMGMDPSKPGWPFWEGLRMLAENVIGERRNFIDPAMREQLGLPPFDTH